MEKQNKRVKAEAGDDVIFDTEAKKKQKKEKQQAVGDHYNQVKNEPVELKAEDVFALNVEQEKKQQQKKEQKVVNGNVKIDAVENVASVTAEEISEGFEAVTGSKTIAVSGFQSGTKEKKIFDHFRGCGFITQINTSTLSEGEKISGLAYIEFEAEDAAKQALGLDGTKLKDRTLKVELSKVQPKKKGPPAKISGCKIAYIGNLPRVVKEDDIRQFFKDSKIESINLALYKQRKHVCRGFGHVLFADDESLENAMKKDDVKLYDRPIKVAYPTEKYTEPSKMKGHGV